MPYNKNQIITQLQRTRDHLIDRRMEIIQNPKPTYSIEQQEIKWGEYLEILNKSLKAVEDELSRYDLAEPYEYETEIYQ